MLLNKEADRSLSHSSLYIDMFMVFFHVFVCLLIMMTDWFEWALVVQYCHFKFLWETRSYTMLSARTTHLCSLVITSHFMYQASTKQSWFNSDVKICVFSFFLIKCLILSRKIKMNKIVSVFLCSLLYVYIVSVFLC